MSDTGKTITARGEKRRRCVWSAAQKREIVAESFEVGSSVAIVARRHGVNANQLFPWRRQLSTIGSAAPAGSGKLAPVTIASEAPPAALASAMETRGRMEIVIPGGDHHRNAFAMGLTAPVASANARNARKGIIVFASLERHELNIGGVLKRSRTVTTHPSVYLFFTSAEIGALTVRKELAPPRRFLASRST